MKQTIHRLWIRRGIYWQSRRQTGSRILLPAVILLVLLPVVFLLMIRPRLTDYAVDYVQYQATMMMERAVADCAGDMEALGTLRTENGGSVTALTTNAAQLNALRTKIVQQVYTEISTLTNGKNTVAVGTLLDPQFLAGIGPKVSFGVVSLGCVTAETSSDFTQSGINQTMHTITIRINADFSVMLPGKRENVTVSAVYPLEQTIIVGEVPLAAFPSE